MVTGGTLRISDTLKLSKYDGAPTIVGAPSYSRLYSGFSSWGVVGSGMVGVKCLVIHRSVDIVVSKSVAISCVGIVDV